MIEIICKDELYTYDVYHITKAFFPAENVRQRVDKDAGALLRVFSQDGWEIACGEEIFSGGQDVTGERRMKKYTLGCWLYGKYKEMTGKTLPWGILTGVRPVKIAMQKLQEGMDKEAFVSWFQKDSLVSEEKAKLAYEIAVRERKILGALDYKDGWSLYVGIPFCPSVCSYCSFSSGSVKEWKDYMDAYMEALFKEIAYIGRTLAGRNLNTIYIGGGTPTALEASKFEELLSCIDRTFSKENLLEYTVEAGRPDSITQEKLQLMKAYGVSRISINPQTMQQRTLDMIGRKHTAEDVWNAFSMARDAGFDNINMDLIAGLPKERAADMKDTLRQVEKMGPDSLTVHALAIKRAAKMGREKTISGFIEGMEELQEQPERAAKELADMIELAHKEARRMRLAPYYLYRQKNIAGNFENVGYAKVDKAGIYNILIMEEKQSIIAAGAGATTKIVLDGPAADFGGAEKGRKTLVRVENVKDIRSYITRIDEMIERKGEWLWH